MKATKILEHTKVDFRDEFFTIMFSSNKENKFSIRHMDLIH